MARLKGQLFARLALDYFDHPKIAALSPEAIVAHLQMVVYARKYGTNGEIPMAIAMRFASQALDELASNDPDNPSIIINDDGTVTIHGYADMQETAEQVQARRQARAEAGRRGAESRWSKDGRSHSRSHGNSHSKSHGKRDGKTMAETETETETETDIRASQASAREPSRFPDWWAIWEKKKAKGDAEKAYKVALKKISHDDLMAKTQTYWDHVKRSGTDLQYVPYPATWLRAEQWDDDLGPSQAPRLDPLKDW